MTFDELTDNNASRALVRMDACSTGQRDFDGVPDGYRAMNEREAPKVMVRP